GPRAGFLLLLPLQRARQGCAGQLGSVVDVQWAEIGLGMGKLQQAERDSRGTQGAVWAIWGQEHWLPEPGQACCPLCRAGLVPQMCPACRDPITKSCPRHSPSTLAKSVLLGRGYLGHQALRVPLCRWGN
uniref:Uncharacterized protein n=1 Tax=Apteryx owenii TaxID=8824 RepID=A0A8B9S4U8_APTOW